MTRQIKTILFVLLVTISVSSCKNLFIEHKNAKNYTTISIAYNNTRTIYPDFEVYSFTDFELKGKKSGTDDWTIIDTWNSYKEISEAKLTISTGTYDFLLEAKQAETTFKSKVIENFKISENGDNDLRFEMKVDNYSRKAQGSFNIKIQWPESLSVKKIVGFLLPYSIDVDEPDFYSGEAIRYDLSSFLDSDDRTLEFSAEKIDSGNYFVKVGFYGDLEMNSQLTEFSDILYIADNIVSSKKIDLQEIIDECHTVTYALNGGQLDSNATEAVFSEKNIYELPIPTKNNHEFLGWYTDPVFTNGIKKTVFGQGDVTEDVTVYARWKAIISEDKLEDILNAYTDKQNPYEITILSESPDFTTIKSSLQIDNAKDIHINLDLSSCTELTSIPDDSFADCSNITDIKISSSVQEIGSRAFKNCTGLNSLPHAKKIGISAFEGCTGISSIDITTETEIGNRAYADCVNVVSINYAGKIDAFEKDNGIFANVGQESEGVKVTVTSSVEKIPAYFCCPDSSLQNVPNIKMVDIQVESVNAVTKIYVYGCKEIGDYAFMGCNGISEVSFGFLDFSQKTNLSKIGTSAFEGCSSITKLNLSNQISTLGDSAFKDCTGLEKITQSGYGLIGSGTGYALKAIGASTFEGCTNLKEINFTESVESIGNKAFKDCSKLSKIQFNNSKLNELNFDMDNQIFANAGSQSENLEVLFADFITAIPDYLFYNNDNEKAEKARVYSLTIPRNVTKIGKAAFRSLNVEKIYYLAVNCADIADVSYHPFESTYDKVSVNISIDVTVIPSGLFYGLKISSLNFNKNTLCTKINTFAFGRSYDESDNVVLNVPAGIQIENSAFENVNVLHYHGDSGSYGAISRTGEANTLCTLSCPKYNESDISMHNCGFYNHNYGESSNVCTKCGAKKWYKVDEAIPTGYGNYSPDKTNPHVWESSTLGAGSGRANGKWEINLNKTAEITVLWKVENQVSKTGELKIYLDGREVGYVTANEQGSISQNLAQGTHYIRAEYTGSEALGIVTLMPVFE